MMHEMHIRTNRRAFTLIEILVVIAILAILAGLGVWGVFAVIGNQQSRNTQNTIMVVNKVMQDQWLYVIEEAKKDTVISPAVVALAGTDPTGERARVLWIKFRLMEAFPQSFDEIGTPPGVVPAVVPPVYTNLFGTGVVIPSNYPGIQQRYIADYQKRIPINGKWLSATQPSTKPPTNTMTASAACLLIALSANRNGTSLRQDDIKFAVKDTDSDGIPELVDSFGAVGTALKQNPPLSGNPLMFTRFDNGTQITPNLLRNANPAAANPNAAAFKYADPVDPNGLLLTSAWYNSVARPSYEKAVQRTYSYQISPDNGVHAYYVIPTIMSSGRDGLMPSADDIYSYQLRGGN